MNHQFASQSTDSFRELLTLAQASLVVSTYEAGQVVLVRPQTQGINTHFVALARPMGIAWRPGELSIGDASSLLTFRNLPGVAGKLDGDGPPSDACYVHRRSHVTGAIDVHEMAYDGDGQLWFVATRMSCLATARADCSFEPRWRPPFVSAWELSDRCHLNGLGLRDGRPRYVSMLGATDTGGGWRKGKVSGGLVMDVSSDEVLADQLCMPHSPRWYRDRLWFLASGTGQLMRAVPGQAPEMVAEVPGFARGLDFIDRYALIGLSQVRESAVFAGLPLTKRVAERKCGVWVVDTENGRIVAFLEFLGGIREVFELKVLPHRRPELLEPGHPLQTNSYEFPDAVLENLAPPDPVQQDLDLATRKHLDGAFDEAIAAYRAIVEAHPGHPQADHQLGLCLVDAERWDEAVDHLQRVVAEQPDNAEAMNSLGLAHARLGANEKALRWLERAIGKDRQFALAHFNRGLILLKLGDYEAGWPEYDWRWQTPQFVPFQCGKPQWQGEDISDQRLLVHSEQGNGDHVQFLRFLPLVAERCRELIYVGPEKLAPLAAAMPGVTESRVPGPIPQDRFDLYCPLMSLPRWLGVTVDAIPAPERYLRIPPQVVVRELGGRFRVGLCWQGSPTQKEDHRRSLALDGLADLVATRGVDWFSLQMPISAEERGWLEAHGVTDLEPELPGYARTAALVDQLDLVITVDTAIAHVAGALGKPVWILLNVDPDWRWGLEGERTAWYPTARLFRQESPGDWEPVLRQVEEALAGLARTQ